MSLVSLLSCLVLGAQPVPPLEELQRTGNGLIARNQLAEAERHFQSAATVAERAGELAWQAEFLRATGETFERRSEHARARAQYQQALDIRLRLAKSADNTRELVRLYAGTGLMSFYLRDDAQALERIRRAVEGYRELGDRSREARNRNLLGMILLNGRELEEAARELESALAIYESLPDKGGMAGCMIRLAELAGRRGDYRAALQWAFRAQPLQPAQTHPRQAAEILEILGNTFSLMQQQDKGLEYHQSCLRLRLKLGDPRPLAGTHSNLAAILAATGDLDAASHAAGKALEIRRGLNAPADVAATLINLGGIELSRKRREEARRVFGEALALCEKHGYVREAAAAHAGLGNILQQEGDERGALQHHGQAYRLQEETADRSGMLTTLVSTALDRELLGELPEALTALQKAHGIWTALAAEVADPAQLGNFRKAAQSLFPQYARVLVRSGQVEEALRISELARGLGLGRMRQLNMRDFVDLLDAEDRSLWLAAAGALARAANRLRVVSEKQAAPAERADAEAAYFQAERELTGLRDRIFATNPRLAAADGAAMDVAAMKAFARANPATLVVSWMTLDDRGTLLFAVSAAEGIRAFELPVGRAAIRAAARQWLEAIGRRPGRGVTARVTASAATEPHLAAELYRMIFGPLQDQVQRTARVALLPDGGLAKIPFAALLDGRGKRLLETTTLTTSVTFRGLLASGPSRQTRESLYAIGDPLANEESRLVVPFGSRFEALPHAREEARALGNLFPKSDVVLGPQAREAVVKQALGKASILHFATHGILAPNDGMRSGLLLATEPEDSTEDGLLQAWEISSLALRARLAVLSACDTGQGDEQLGEGVMGLAWAFQAAGCPNVIASLWSVDDAAARHLMLAFYRQLRAGMAVDEALRRAMIEMARIPAFSQPYFWAPFQLYGPGGVRQPKPTDRRF